MGDSSVLNIQGGGWEIRTPEGISPLPPFQGGALGHYANPPVKIQ